MELFCGNYEVINVVRVVKFSKVYGVLIEILLYLIVFDDVIIFNIYICINFSNCMIRY